MNPPHIEIENTKNPAVLNELKIIKKELNATDSKVKIDEDAKIICDDKTLKGKKSIEEVFKKIGDDSIKDFNDLMNSYLNSLPESNEKTKFDKTLEQGITNNGYTPATTDDGIQAVATKEPKQEPEKKPVIQNTTKGNIFEKEFETDGLKQKLLINDTDGNSEWGDDEKAKLLSAEITPTKAQSAFDTLKSLYSNIKKDPDFSLDKESKIIVKEKGQKPAEIKSGDDFKRVMNFIDDEHTTFNETYNEFKSDSQKVSERQFNKVPCEPTESEECKDKYTVTLKEGGTLSDALYVYYKEHKDELAGMNFYGTNGFLATVAKNNGYGDVFDTNNKTINSLKDGDEITIKF